MINIKDTESFNFSCYIQYVLKRGMDIILSVLGLVILSPLIVLISIAIKLDTEGPVIYRHKRIGKFGKPFILNKFRSMVNGGDDSSYLSYLEQLIESSKNGHGRAYRKMEKDPRVTRIGSILRKYYFDEIPQLWNILKGEMSVVGPRPHVHVEVQHYTDKQLKRLTVKPGATGLWQVDGKAGCTFIELIEMDLDYINHWTILLDVEILVKTIVMMLHGGEGVWTRKSKSIPIKEVYTVKDICPDPIVVDSSTKVVKEVSNSAFD
jgi:lipopolysaccharide/colanic/teichoic acid biosynthesis glycosyltransferase